jgi:hypothetical protein
MRLGREIWLSAGSRRLSRGVSGCFRRPFSRDCLVKLRQKARRNGCYYSVLKSGERVLLDLTIRVVERVRSFILAGLVSRIVDKLLEALESRVYRLMRVEGRRLAEKVSRIGVGWGLRGAKSWAGDWGFIQFLTVSNLGSLGVS